MQVEVSHLALASMDNRFIDLLIHIIALEGHSETILSLQCMI
jgi:hypothetical protein